MGLCDVGSNFESMTEFKNTSFIILFLNISGMDRDLQVEALRKDLMAALEEKGNGKEEDKEEIKRLLEALELMKEQPEIREGWSKDDELLYNSKCKPRKAHVPNWKTESEFNNSTSERLDSSGKNLCASIEDVLQNESPPVTNKSIKESLPWKGVIEKNFKK